MPALLKRLSMVPVLSSAARMPLPRASISLTVWASSDWVVVMSGSAWRLRWGDRRGGFYGGGARGSATGGTRRRRLRLRFLEQLDHQRAHAPRVLLERGAAVERR